MNAGKPCRTICRSNSRSGAGGSEKETQPCYIFLKDLLPVPSMPPRPGEVTALLKAWGGCGPAALKRLKGHVYDELRLIARRYMRNERAGNTLHWPRRHT